MIFELGDSEFDVPEMRQLLQAVLSENKSFRDYEITYNFKDPGQRSFLINAKLLSKVSEEDTLILLSFQDMSGDIQTEKHEKHYLRRFRDILAHAPAMICTLKGPQHVFELANEKYFQLVGHRDVIGKPVREVIPEVENQGFFEILDKVYNTGRPYIGNEVPIALDTGEKSLKNSFVDFVYQPMLNGNGEVDGIFVHVVDVTEKVEARKKVEENEDRLRKLIDTVPAIIWITNKEGHNSYLNKNWYNYTGQNKQQAKQFGWLNAVHPEDRDEAEQEFREANSNRKSYNTTYRLRRFDGHYRWVMANSRPKYSVDDQYEGMVGTVVEIHEEKIKEQQIREKEHRIRTIVEQATVATAVYTGKELKIELANDAMIQLWEKDKSVIGKNLPQALP